MKLLIEFMQKLLVVLAKQLSEKNLFNIWIINLKGEKMSAGQGQVITKSTGENNVMVNDR